MHRRLLACSARTTTAAAAPPAHAPADAPLLLLTTASAPSPAEQRCAAPPPAAGPRRLPGLPAHACCAFWRHLPAESSKASDTESGLPQHCAAAAAAAAVAVAGGAATRDHRVRHGHLACCLASSSSPSSPPPAARQPAAPPPAWPLLLLFAFSLLARVYLCFSLVRRICNRPRAPTRLASHELGRTAGMPDLRPGIPAAGLSSSLALRVRRPLRQLHNQRISAPGLPGALWQRSTVPCASPDRGCRREAGAPAACVPSVSKHRSALVAHGSSSGSTPPRQRFGSGGNSSADLQHKIIAHKNLGDSPGTGVLCEMAVTLTHFKKRFGPKRVAPRRREPSRRA